MATASGQTNEEEKTSLLRELSHVFLEQVLFVTFLSSGAQDVVLFKLFTEGKPSWEKSLKSYVNSGQPWKFSGKSRACNSLSTMMLVQRNIQNKKGILYNVFPLKLCHHNYTLKRMQ